MAKISEKVMTELTAPELVYDKLSSPHWGKKDSQSKIHSDQSKIPASPTTYPI